MLEEMQSSPIQYDEDCPPLTEEQLRKMVRVGRKNMWDRSGKTAPASDKEEHINTENPQNKNWDQFERATEMFSDDFMEDGRASQEASGVQENSSVP